MKFELTIGVKADELRLRSGWKIEVEVVELVLRSDLTNGDKVVEFVLRFDWTNTDREARRIVLREPTEKAKVHAIDIRIHALQLKWI